MSNQTINGVPIEAILNPLADDPNLVERIAHRKVKAPELAIVEPDPQWFDHFETFKARILAALEPRGADDGNDGSRVDILSIDHVGSTSVPGLPAKAVIDIDLVLSSYSLSAEAYYVPRLEAAGFQFLLREPAWYEHRFFAAWEPMSCNLHIWPLGSPQLERHRIFRDWLKESKDDRELYARTKRESAAVAREKGQDMRDYSLRKDKVVQEILTRAVTALGYQPS